MTPNLSPASSLYVAETIFLYHFLNRIVLGHSLAPNLAYSRASLHKLRCKNLKLYKHRCVLSPPQIVTPISFKTFRILGIEPHLCILIFFIWRKVDSCDRCNQYCEQFSWHFFAVSITIIMNVSMYCPKPLHCKLNKVKPVNSRDCGVNCGPECV